MKFFQLPSHFLHVFGQKESISSPFKVAPEPQKLALDVHELADLSLHVIPSYPELKFL